MSFPAISRRTAKLVRLEVLAMLAIDRMMEQQLLASSDEEWPTGLCY